MPRITHVARAQQRYATRVVLDADGNPRKTPVLRSDGTQKTTKTGRPVYMTVTERDLDRPLPPRICDACSNPIVVGTPYKHISPKSGPYGGRQLNRHKDCPSWHVWEYSSSLLAQIARIEHDLFNALDSIESVDDATAALSDAAQEIRDLADAKNEGADNIESGFGHETSQSAELREMADNLETWADEVEATDVEDYPEPDECIECDGTGEVEVEDGTETCGECSGTGIPDQPTEDQIDEWRSTVRGAAEDVMGNQP